MSDTPLPAATGPERPIGAFIALTRSWLTAPDRGNARTLILLLLVLTGAQVAVQFRFNLFNRDFFNALDARDRAAFQRQIVLFCALAATSMAVSVYQLKLKQMIQLRWREWLTARLLSRWMHEGRQYQLEMAGGAADNPEQRIAQDARVAIDLSVDFVAGLVTSALMLTVFLGVLWNVSGALHFAAMGHDVTIKGYMVWAALFYAGAGTALTYWVGRPLVPLNIAYTSGEADFRFGLTRARESGEGIALIRGEADERRGLSESFETVIRSLAALMRSQRNLMWLTSAYGALAMIFPTIVAAPGYFAGSITLGGLMQVTAAFGQVQVSLNWFVDNFPRIAEWRSAVTRLMTLQEALDELDRLFADPSQPIIAIREGPDGTLIFRGVEVAFANGTTVIADASAEIRAGERVLIKGESGTGKSTLFRAIAGLWPWGAGEITVPPPTAMMFMPQRPYLPLGTLSGALSYPAPSDKFTPEDYTAALETVGLAHLVPRLEEIDRWDRVLSVGEQQRVAFARLLLHKPAWIFMDEATAALDEANQDAMMNLVLEKLPDSALVSIGHRPGLENFHTRSLTLQRAEGGARLARPPRPVKPRKRWVLRIRRKKPAPS